MIAHSFDDEFLVVTEKEEASASTSSLTSFKHHVSIESWV